MNDGLTSWALAKALLTSLAIVLSRFGMRVSRNYWTCHPIKRVMETWLGSGLLTSNGCFPFLLFFWGVELDVKNKTRPLPPLTSVSGFLWFCLCSGCYSQDLPAVLWVHVEGYFYCFDVGPPFFFFFFLLFKKRITPTAVRYLKRVLMGIPQLARHLGFDCSAVSGAMAETGLLPFKTMGFQRRDRGKRVGKPHGRGG